MLARFWLMATAIALLAGCLAPSKYARYESQFEDKPQIREFARAAEFGDVKKVQRMMKDGFNPDLVFGREGTPVLAIPVLADQPETLIAMLEAGADPNAKQTFDNGYGSISNRNNAMVWAAKADSPRYLGILIDHGGDPNTRNSNDETLMMQARLWGDSWDNVKMLVEKGADPNGMSQQQTVAESYARIGSFSKVHWLLEHGADLSKDNSANRSTIDSIFWYPVDPKYWYLQRDCQQWLLTRGYKRPPISQVYVDIRKQDGLPYTEAEIPLW